MIRQKPCPFLPHALPAIKNYLVGVIFLIEQPCVDFFRFSLVRYLRIRQAGLLCGTIFMQQQKKIMIQAAVAILAVWLLVFGIRTWAGSKKITAEKVNQAVQSAQFADWSQEENPEAGTAAQREKKLREIAGLINRLDFQEREKNRENRSGEQFFKVLSPRERSLFIELTIAESMNKFMEALDQMPAKDRQKFVKQGLAEIEKGKTADDMKRTQELGDDVMNKITEEGMRAYFEKANSETKLDLAPLMESMNEVMQGMRGNRFGPPGAQ
jgi:hypothetical protein